MDDKIILDRELLGIRKFWLGIKKAQSKKQAIVIKTNKKKFEELPYDLKKLLGSTYKHGGAGVVVGLTPAEISLILEVLQWIVILALVGTTIFLISKKYKFKIKRDADGSISIEGEPIQ